MPIQFPRPTGPYRSYIETQWLLKHKKFDAVPAPNLGNPGGPLNTKSLNPGQGIRKAVNLRNLGRPYTAPDQTARVNPASNLRDTTNNRQSFDRVLGETNYRIVGVSRDATGAALGGCTVKVFRTEDDVLVASTVSDGSGNWTAYPNQTGPYYFVEYKAGSPDVFGTSPNTRTATPFNPGE